MYLRYSSIAAHNLTTGSRDIILTVATKKSPPKEAKPPKKEAAAFKVTLTLGKTVYEAEGDDLTQTILSFQVPKVNARAFFQLFHNGKTSKLSRRAYMTRRTLNNKLFAFYLGRNLTRLLK